MRILDIPDIHLKYQTVDLILEKYESTVDKVMFHGDYFDDRDDTVWQNEQMAKWLKQSLKHSNRIHLTGNHDIGYRYAHNMSAKCSGWTYDKQDAINKIMTESDWKQMPFYYYSPENDFYFSHGGISKQIFEHPIEGFNPARMKTMIDKAANLLNVDGCLPTEFGIGYSRGGRQRQGGITWLDFEREFEVIEGINQIVGHTPNHNVRKKIGINSVNYGIDTGLNHVCILDGQMLEVIEVPKTHDDVFANLMKSL
jgi:hypothetical protein